MARTANRIDGNHREIKKHLIAIGCKVIDGAARGMPVDLIVFYRGSWSLIEIKLPNKIKKGRWESLTNKGTQNEQKFVKNMAPAPYYVVTSQSEAQGVVMQKPDILEECQVKPKYF